MDKKLAMLRKYFEDKGITQVEIANRMGVDKTYVNQLMTGKKNFGKRVAKQWSDLFGLSFTWLLTGDGEMEITPTEAVVSTRPRLTINVTGGENEVLDGVTLEQCEQVPVVPMFPRYDFTMRVTGESMLPYISPGDEVACLKVEESSFLQWGRIHVLFTSQGVIVKRIFDAVDGIRCVSINEDYQDFIVPKSEIYSY